MDPGTALIGLEIATGVCGVTGTALIAGGYYVRKTDRFAKGLVLSLIGAGVLGFGLGGAGTVLYDNYVPPKRETAAPESNNRGYKGYALLEDVVQSKHF